MNTPSQYKSPVRCLSRDTNEWPMNNPSQYKSPVKIFKQRGTNEYSFAI